jgi:NAD(P)-dependent dehydrogenase (short-subunit alcohol dehydrogenase family)
MSAHAIIDPATVFLVSGGARGITARCVVGMAARFGCRFILLGRTTLEPVPDWAAPALDDAELKQRIASEIAGRSERPTPIAIQREFNAIRARQEIEATLRGIAEAGGRAEYICANVADQAALQAALTPAVARLGPVVGIVHGAGALADKRIEQKTAADFDTVVAPKIGGLHSLLACVPPDRLRHLVLFSSAAGFFGNIGQTDYAIANEMLNKAAYQLQREHPACRVVALNWGPWDAGMVTPALKALFTQRKIEVIPVDGGVQVLVAALATDRPAVQLVVGSPMTLTPAALDGELRQYRVRRRLTLAANPFLADHVIGQHAVLPATTALAWMADACEQRYPGYHMVHFNDYQVLKGIVFDATLADSYSLDLKEIAKSEASGRVQLTALVASATTSGRPAYHYRAGFELRREIPDAPIYAGLDLREHEALDGQALYEDGTLFHGPSFRGVEWVLNCSAARLTLRCRLPAIATQTQGQFPARGFNPYLLDIMFQACVIWARRMHGAASLPLACASGEHYTPLYFDTTYYVSLEIRDAGEHQLRADLIAHDERGRVALRLSGAEVTISRQLNRLFVPHASPIRAV